ncbi:biotin transport system ATP-binding protein [Pseudoclavibacter chungangensis]|uniref:energy-coupling factor ABC transporter ATP-binding protein n=1 Tax=Pseudoclavibacter chungangensis TaxID=587635 RepID=UPI0017FA6284|nr:ABC transporter ATP-binding protein [Pseudoclavibacter chungangensis]NYJ66645.1 biotin transport system ATP-binding protein [Pseudoclavibacter chungangensis]
MSPRRGALAGPVEGAPVIDYEGVDVDLDGVPVLRDVGFRSDARRIAVVGANGSGKSTFVRTLNGLVRPSAGRARVLGLDPVADGAAVRRHVGFVFSNPDVQLILPTVGEDLALSLRGQGLSKAEIAERVERALEDIGLAGRRDESAYALSGGQKQLLALAGVLIRRPGLVVADEPTAFLDAANARRIADRLLEQDERAVVIVTHDPALARRCDVAIRFDGGRLVDEGEPGRVVADYLAALP